MRVVVDDGVGLEVVEAGSGPALVLVHGFSGAKEDFADHIDAFSQTHHVIAFDHRGHGASDNTGDPPSYSLQRMAADVVAVADRLGVGPFRLLGHSMGGMVAQHVAVAHPDRVQALVLVDTCPGAPAGVDPAAASVAAAIAREHGIETLHAVLDDRDPLLTPAKERLLRERPGHKAYGDANFKAQDPEMYAQMVVEMTTRADMSGALASLACPTLVVAGEQDGAMIAGCRSIAGCIPNARLAVIPDAGHSPHFENPQAWFVAVRDFLLSL